MKAAQARTFTTTNFYRSMRAFGRQLLVVFAFLLPCISYAQVTVTPAQTALAMAQKLAGKGVTILNPQLTCDPYASGLFSITSTAMTLDSGIVLTNGNVYALGGYSGVNASTNLGMPGDPQLAQLAGSTTYDACRLEFDVVPKGDSLRFDYVFGSEEYNNATCGTYNDAFSFFISGPGIAGSVNMALVPGTSIPVAVNSINNGIPGSQGNIANCYAMGAGSPFTQYYVDNSVGTTLTYRGFTKVLTATHAVIPCSTYHLKLTIADAGNALYDSGVFLKAGSLNTNIFSMSAAINGIATDTPVIAKGCAPATITIKRKGARTTPQTLRLGFGGNAVRGTDVTAVADSVIIPANDSLVQFDVYALTLQPAGPKTFTIRLLSPYSCAAYEVLDSVVITIADAPSVKIITPDTTICKGTSFTLRAAGSNGLSYSWSPAAGLNNAGTLLPVIFTQSATTYVLTGILPHSGCAPVKDTIVVEVKDPPLINVGGNTEACTGDTIHLTGNVSSGSSGYSYDWSAPGGFTSTTQEFLLSSVTTANSGIYAFTASDGVCTRTDTQQVTVHAIPDAPAVISPFRICLHGQQIALQASGNNLLWYEAAIGGTGASTAFQPGTDDTGHYRYYVSQTVLGCESGRAAIDAIVEKCCGDELIIPSAFSPNSDGKNDYFGIGNSAANVKYHIRIFNRWGELVYHGIRGDHWDGSFHGQPAPPGIYGYDLLIDCSNGNRVERKGDLMLVR